MSVIQVTFQLNKLLFRGVIHASLKNLCRLLHKPPDSFLTTLEAYLTEGFLKETHGSLQRPLTWRRLQGIWRKSFKVSDHTPSRLLNISRPFFWKEPSRTAKEIHSWLLNRIYQNFVISEEFFSTSEEKPSGLEKKGLQCLQGFWSEVFRVSQETPSGLLKRVLLNRNHLGFWRETLKAWVHMYDYIHDYICISQKILESSPEMEVIKKPSLLLDFSSRNPWKPSGLPKSFTASSLRHWQLCPRKLQMCFPETASKNLGRFLPEFIGNSFSNSRSLHSYKVSLQKLMKAFMASGKSPSSF